MVGHQGEDRPPHHPERDSADLGEEGQVRDIQKIENIVFNP